MRVHTTIITNPDKTITTEETPYTFQEEIQADARDFWKQIALDVVGGLPWPTTYDEFKQRINMSKVVDAMLTRKGLNPAKITREVKQVLEITVEFAIWSVIYIHGKLPSEVL